MNAWLITASNEAEGFDALHPATQVTTIICVTVGVCFFLWGMLFRD